MKTRGLALRSALRRCGARTALALFAALLAVACSDTEESSGTTTSAPRREREARDPGAQLKTEPVAPKAIDPAMVGAVHGVVTFAGDPPRRKELGMGNEPACQHHATSPRTEKVVVNDGKLQGVFVYLRRGHEGWILPATPTTPAVLDQRGCIYTPHVVALQTGQPLHVHNNDEATHNVNLDARRNGQTGNFTMGRGQDDLVFVFERREHGIPFKCDIHPWMGAVVHVQDHPWFAVTGPDGSFTIPAVPPGTYTVEAIHPELGKERQEVVVARSATAEADFAFED